jgi:spore cortex formation protein SpoVR/YcgB (stage V sporulation)
VIEVFDANFANRGELCLVHRHVGIDLRWDWAQEVLGHLTHLWRRPVRLESMRGAKLMRLGHDGKTINEEMLIAPPANTAG